jgi:hypothetical protein
MSVNRLVGVLHVGVPHPARHGEVAGLAAVDADFRVAGISAAGTAAGEQRGKSLVYHQAQGPGASALVYLERVSVYSKDCRGGSWSQRGHVR